MTNKPNLHLVPREKPKRALPSIAQINRADGREGDIVALVACLSFDARDEALPFSSMRLAERLRRQLHAIAGRIPDPAFIEIASICGELLNDGAQSILADHMARLAVVKAMKESK